MAPGRNKHHAVKPHLARQARQEAAAAESAAQLESFVVEAREATILPLQSQEDIEYVQSLARREGDRGGHLIRWAGGGGGGGDGDGDGDGQAEDVSEVWLDSHDVLHLLPNLPKTPDVHSSPNSSTGWTDLPSDAEDTFFLDDTEQEEYERAKKKRKFDGLREERMRQLEERAAKEWEEREKRKRDDPRVWQGDDEEPPQDVHQLMTHTLSALVASPNPQILELRILTNHAGDHRFEFLKGRYRNCWQRMKDERMSKHAVSEAAPTAAAPAIRGLLGAGYDSDSASESDEEEDEDAAGNTSPESGAVQAPPAEEPPSPPPLPPEPDELAEPAGLPPSDLSPPLPPRPEPLLASEDLKAQRRQKAQDWLNARRQERKE